MPLPSVSKAAYSGFEPQRRGISGSTKRAYDLQKLTKTLNTRKRLRQMNVVKMKNLQRGAIYISYRDIKPFIC